MLFWTSGTLSSDIAVKTSTKEHCVCSTSWREAFSDDLFQCFATPEKPADLLLLLFNPERSIHFLWNTSHKVPPICCVVLHESTDDAVHSKKYFCECFTDTEMTSCISYHQSSVNWSLQQALPCLLLIPTVVMYLAAVTVSIDYIYTLYLVYKQLIRYIRFFRNYILSLSH